MYRGVAGCNPCKSSATWGPDPFTAVQNISDKLGVVAAFDMKDTLASSIADGCSDKTKAESNRIIPPTPAVVCFFASSPNLKATVTYEHPTEQGTNKKDNDFAMAPAHRALSRKGGPGQRLHHSGRSRNRRRKTIVSVAGLRCPRRHRRSNRHRFRRRRLPERRLTGPGGGSFLQCLTLVGGS